MWSINVLVINQCNRFDHLYPNKGKLRIFNTFTKSPKYQTLGKTFGSLPHTHTHTHTRYLLFSTSNTPMSTAPINDHKEPCSCIR